MYKVLSLSIIIIITFLSSVYSDIIYPTDDMYTDVEHTGAHIYDELWVANYSPSGHFERINIKFDLNIYIGTQVDSAYLNLYRFFGCPAGGVTQTNFYNITEDWDEGTWPGNVHLNYSTTSWVNYGFATNGWHKINITSLVQSWINCSIDNYGLVIIANSGSKWSKFYSKESTNPSVKPYLEIYTSTGVEEEDSINEFGNINISPNPFYSFCRISTLNGENIEIYDISGKKVYSICSNEGACIWKPGSDISKGTYFIHTHLNIWAKVIYIK